MLWRFATGSLPPGVVVVVEQPVIAPTARAAAEARARSLVFMVVSFAEFARLAMHTTSAWANSDRSHWSPGLTLRQADGALPPRRNTDAQPAGASAASSAPHGG